MSAPTTRIAAAIGAVTVAASLALALPTHADTTRATVATGLHSPRQLAFSPQGALYVAEGGLAGTENCQEHPELGRVCVGLTGSVARIGLHKGEVTRVLSGLPSIGSTEEASGPSDIAFRDGRRIAVSIGLGGTPELRAGFGRDGRLLGQVVEANLNATSPGRTVHADFDVARYELRKNPDGGAVDSNGTGLTWFDNGWVVADAGGNSLVSSRRGGSTLAVFAPVPTTAEVVLPPPPDGPGTLPAGFPAEAVPTDVVKGPDGALYVSQLVGFPFEKGSSSIWKVRPGKAPVAVATGLTNVTSLAFGAKGELYAVELASNGLLAGPTGSLVRVGLHGAAHQVVAADLFAPYGVAVRGGYAYVTTGSVTPAGEVVKIKL